LHNEAVGLPGDEAIGLTGEFLCGGASAKDGLWWVDNTTA